MPHPMAETVPEPYTEEDLVSRLHKGYYKRPWPAVFTTFLHAIRERAEMRRDISALQTRLAQLEDRLAKLESQPGEASGDDD
jgi:hypothetical protein